MEDRGGGVGLAFLGERGEDGLDSCSENGEGEGVGDGVSDGNLMWVFR